MSLVILSCMEIQLLSQKSLRSNLSEIILPKQTFSRQKLQESEELLEYLLGDEGFAFPEV